MPNYDVLAANLRRIRADPSIQHALGTTQQAQLDEAADALQALAPFAMTLALHALNDEGVSGAELLELARQRRLIVDVEGQPRLGPVLDMRPVVGR